MRKLGQYSIPEIDDILAMEPEGFKKYKSKEHTENHRSYEEKIRKYEDMKEDLKAQMRGAKKSREIQECVVGSAMRSR